MAVASLTLKTKASRDDPLSEGSRPGHVRVPNEIAPELHVQACLDKHLTCRRSEGRQDLVTVRADHPYADAQWILREHDAYDVESRHQRVAAADATPMRSTPELLSEVADALRCARRSTA